jgi:hypothetical protein
MAIKFQNKNSSLPNGGVIDELRLNRFTWKTGGAVLGLGGGIAAPLLGSILTAVAWFTGPSWHGISVERDGLVLLFLTIPLLVLGAHFLDLIDREL